MSETRAQRLQGHHRQQAKRGHDEQRRAPARLDRQHRRHHPRQHQAGRHAGLLDREDQRREVTRREPAQQVRTRGCGKRLPQPAHEGADGKQRQPARGRDGKARAQGQHADLGHAQRPVAADEAAAAHRGDEARDRADREIDPDQCGVDMEIGHDGGGNQRHRRAPERRKGLLHRHGAEREVEIEDFQAPGRSQAECRDGLRLSTATYRIPQVE